MDGLTTEDIKRLSAPFEPHEYGIRVGTKDKDGKYVMWLVYVEEDAIVDRLNEVAPNWTWDIRNTQSGEGYIATYGRLTINGVSREGVGTGSPDTGTKIGENEEKGAATDALKRCARLFGLGLELKRDDIGRIYTDGADTSKNAKAEALRKFTAAYQQVFGAKPAPSSKPAPVVREVVQQKPSFTPLSAVISAPNGDEQNPATNPFNGQPATPPPADETGAEHSAVIEAIVEKVFVQQGRDERISYALLPAGVVIYSRDALRECGIECEDWKPGKQNHILTEKLRVTYRMDGTAKKFVTLERVA